MNNLDQLSHSILQRKAIVYVRQSTASQVQDNKESQRRQYELVEVAREYGFREVDVIDDDLGRSASGSVARPGFDRLVAQLCTGLVGAILCLEASRLSRNGRDWHHLLELCGLVDARVIDVDGVYNPSSPNDRLLLGMKGTINEFEIGVLRARMVEAARSKARRGELRISVPIGFIWDREAGIHFDPDVRTQEVITLIFRKFRELGSARQVHLSLGREGIHFPRPCDGKRTTSFDWRVVRYRNVISVLKNPFYAGAYAYGKSEKRTRVVDGHGRSTYGHSRPLERWDILLKEHHDGFITWDEYETNQAKLAKNAYGKATGVKSGRGGRALLSGLLTCARCGRRLTVAYSGKSPAPKYHCDRIAQVLGVPRCISFGARRADEALKRELLRAVEPMAIEAAMEAEQMQAEGQAERRRLLELELEQSRYEATLAERRYAACDPDNRLIASQLEKRWEATLRRLKACEERLLPDEKQTTAAQVQDLQGLAADLDAAWNAPTTTMRTRQRLVRTVVEDIVADVDEHSGEIVLVIHWVGGHHSEVRTKKPKSGEHQRRASSEAMGVVRSMAGRWPDDQIAATLNRMGLRTGQDKSWTSRRVASLRYTHKIHAYRSSDKDGQWLTMSEAAKELGVTNHVVRRLIHDGDLPALQVVANAPYQIRMSDVRSDRVTQVVANRARPCRSTPSTQSSLFSDS